MVIKMKTNALCMMINDRNWCPESNYYYIRNAKSEEQTTKMANFKMNKFRFHLKRTKSTNPLLLPTTTTIVGSLYFQCLNATETIFCSIFSIVVVCLLNGDFYRNPIEL